MARQARIYSSTGLYHIVMKGIDKKNIFHDDEDKQAFLVRLKKAREMSDFKLIAYCLMDNHVHLVIRESELIGQSIKRFAVSYVDYYHKKYGTSGHFFSNRYHSDAIETEGYLFRAIRYTHQNPVRAKMTEDCGTYPWTSYEDYLYGEGWSDASIMSELFPSHQTYIEYHKNRERKFAEGERCTVFQRIDAVLVNEGYTVDRLSKGVRDYMIVKIYKEYGFKKKLIAEYFRVSANTVGRIVKGA